LEEKMKNIRALGLGLCLLTAFSVSGFAQEKTLFERLGGTPGVSAVVDDFALNVLNDTRINKKFAKSDPKRLATYLQSFICFATGGPCRYAGQGLKESHKNMGITAGEIQALVENMIKTLNKFNVGDLKQEELVTALGRLGSDIVESESTALSAQTRHVDDLPVRTQGLKNYDDDLPFVDQGLWNNDGWKVYGGNLHNTHSSFTERKINTRNASRLSVKWTFTTGGDVSATPTIEGRALYVPDYGGNLFKLNARDGSLIWSTRISDYTGNPASYSRNSPAIAYDRIILGDQASGTVMAVDKYTGNLLWKTLVDPHPAAIITNSPVVFEGRIYVGVSSRESGIQPVGYQFSFRGSVNALDLHTGEIIWKTYTVPEGYTGGSVWGSSFPIDKRRRTLYATTGNNYVIPESVAPCVQQAPNPQAQLACLSRKNYVDSVLSLDLATGRIRWSNRVQGADFYNTACFFAADPPCPNPQGPDYDFGSGANLFTVVSHRGIFDVVGAGQKSGYYWAFDPDDGRVLWSTQVGPGGFQGGIQWGSATDGRRIYVAVANSTHASHTLKTSNSVTTTGGSWAALDPATGEILWQVPATGQDPQNPDLNAIALGQVSVANGVVYAGSMSGDMVALNSANGRILWKFASGGSVICGPSIVDGTVYWGSGYANFGFGIPNNKLYAFTLLK
jgi:polyvinyl alcohol dehydrogenase (cytochrome)